MFNFNTAIHVLTCKLAGQWPTWKSYKNQFLFQKEHGRPYDFCRVTDQVSWAYCMCIVHPRSTIFGTHILTISSINNIRCTTQEKKVPMVQIYIYVFLKIADLKSLWKMEHFCVKLEISAQLVLHIK